MLKIHLDYGNYDSLIDCLTDCINPQNFTPRHEFLDRVSDLIYGGAHVGITLYLNGRRILGGENTMATDSWDLLWQLNNVFYYILCGKKKESIYLYDNYIPNLEDTNKYTLVKVYLLFASEDANVTISSTHRLLTGLKKKTFSFNRYTQFFIHPQNEKVRLYQAIEEIVHVVREYRDNFLKAVSIVSPGDVEEVKNRYFSYEKIGSVYKLWLPLEQAWKEYKDEHGITEEEVKRVIMEEEKKEEELKKEEEKKNKKWCYSKDSWFF